MREFRVEEKLGEEVRYTPRTRGDFKNLDPKDRAKELYRSKGRSTVRSSHRGPVTYRNPKHPWLDATEHQP